MQKTPVEFPERML